jgi:hypothetical protein
VGANAGQSALSFRLYDRRTPILSIEPNPYHEPSLRVCKRLLRPFDYLICAAGAENGLRTLYIPMFRGVPLTGEASLLREEAERNHWITTHVGTESPYIGLSERTVEVKRLDDLDVARSIKSTFRARAAVLQGLSARHAPWAGTAHRTGRRWLFEELPASHRLRLRAYVFDAGRRRRDSTPASSSRTSSSSERAAAIGRAGSEPDRRARQGRRQDPGL